VKRILPIFLCILLCVSLLACARRPEREQGRFCIVTAAFPEYDFARAVAGELAEIHMLLPPGASAHSFDPSPADMRRILDADIFLYTGGEGEVWIDTLLAAWDGSGPAIVCLVDFMDYDGLDPHIWTSPQKAMLLLDAITEGICAKDPENASIYWENSDRYWLELREIDRELIELVTNAPRNKIVVADRFPFYYLANDYGLTYAAAFSGCSDQADASAKTVASLINAVAAESIPYVYYVEFSNRRVAEAICGQTGAGMLLLHSCHNVTRDDFESGVTYADLMRGNLINLRKGLGSP